MRNVDAARRKVTGFAIEAVTWSPNFPKSFDGDTLYKTRHKGGAIKKDVGKDHKSTSPVECISRRSSRSKGTQPLHQDGCLTAEHYATVCHIDYMEDLGEKRHATSDTALNAGADLAMGTIPS